MGLSDELMTNGMQGMRGPTPILNRLAALIIGGGICLACFLIGGQGFIIALLGRTTTAEITGVWDGGGRGQGSKVMGYSFPIPGGKTGTGTMGFSKDVFQAKKVEIRYLPFYPAWSDEVGGSRPVDLFRYFMICVIGGMVGFLAWNLDRFLDFFSSRA